MTDETKKKFWKISPIEAFVCVGIIFVLFTLLIPAVNDARTTPKKSNEIKKLKNIGLAMFLYYSDYGQFPQNVTDKNGKALLSWRVRLLPYLKEEELYRQFDLTQAWDSEVNLQLANQMPRVFRSPTLRNSWFEENRHTCFLVPIGVDLPEPLRTIYSKNQVCDLDEIEDEFRRTLLVVEVSVENEVVWSKPEDYRFDPDSPKEGLGEYYSGIYLVSFVDGSVRAISSDISDEELRALFTINGGEEFPEDR